MTDSTELSADQQRHDDAPGGDATAAEVVDEGNETVAPEETGVLEAESADEARDADEDDESSESEGEAEEGDIAADYLEELLDIVDLDGDIEIEIRGDRTYISIQAEDGGDELQDLVGSKGEVLDALQELTRLAVLTATGSRTRLVLDISEHRKARNNELKELTDQAMAKARESGEKVHLEPMSAFERKIVHDFVAEEGLVSESEGEGARRHVVVSAA